MPDPEGQVSRLDTATGPGGRVRHARLHHPAVRNLPPQWQQRGQARLKPQWSQLTHRGGGGGCGRGADAGRLHLTLANSLHVGEVGGRGKLGWVSCFSLT